jgi:hypothetical protein
MIYLSFRKISSFSLRPLPPGEGEMYDYKIQGFEAGKVLTTFHSLPSTFLFNFLSVADI